MEILGSLLDTEEDIKRRKKLYIYIERSYICIYICVYIYIYIYVLLKVCIYIYTHTRKYIYIYFTVN